MPARRLYLLYTFSHGNSILFIPPSRQTHERFPASKWHRKIPTFLTQNANHLLTKIRRWAKSVNIGGWKKFFKGLPCSTPVGHLMCCLPGSRSTPFSHHLQKLQKSGCSAAQNPLSHHCVIINSDTFIVGIKTDPLSSLWDRVYYFFLRASSPF